MQCVLFEGPWFVYGLVLQLSPWQPNFQQVTARLDTLAIRGQLHHLPLEW